MQTDASFLPVVMFFQSLVCQAQTFGKDFAQTGDDWSVVELEDNADDSWQYILDTHGYNSATVTDLTESAKIKLPEPVCAYVNITGISQMPATKAENLQAWLEFYDGSGHYFKKRVTLNAHGDSSLRRVKKNVTVKFYEESWGEGKTPDITFGNWVKQDAFHLKAYYTDFFRGSGTKPTNLPVWIPDEQDGDDSNPIVGAMDEYGNCETLTDTPAVTWYINTNINYSSTDNFTYPNTVVLQDGILNIIGSTMLMKRGSTIRVQSGGKLIVHGGQILEADIVVENGGSLIIDDGGLIRLRHNGQYQAQIGAKVTIKHGKIENS